MFKFTVIFLTPQSYTPSVSVEVKVFSLVNIGRSDHPSIIPTAKIRVVETYHSMLGAETGPGEGAKVPDTPVERIAPGIHAFSCVMSVSLYLSYHLHTQAGFWSRWDWSHNVEHSFA